MSGRGPGCRRGWVAVALATALGAPAAASPGPLRSFDLRVSGEVRNVLPADLDGDGKLDLLVSHALYLDPQRTAGRRISIFLQTETGFSSTPSQIWSPDLDAVAVDVARLEPGGPLALVVVRADRIDRRAFVEGRIARRADLLAEHTSFFDEPDWTGVRVWDLARDLDGDGVDELLLPTLGGTEILGRGPEGRYRRRQLLASPSVRKITTPQESEWLIDRLESFELRFDRVIPKLLLREWDGDGHLDLVHAWHDQVHVHRALGDGTFHERGQRYRTAALQWTTVLRYSRAGNLLRIEVEDVTGDGLADVLVGRTRIKDVSAEHWTRVYRNLGGRLDLNARRLAVEGLTMGPIIEDLDGDGTKDVLIWRVELGVGMLVRYALFGTAVITHDLFLSDGTGEVGTDPVSSVDSVFEFDPGRTSSASFAGRAVDGDFDGDGLNDLLVAADPDSWNLFLNRGKPDLFDEALTLEVPASYYVTTADLDADGRSDLVVRHEHRDGLSSRVQVHLSRIDGP